MTGHFSRIRPRRPIILETIKRVCAYVVCMFSEYWSFDTEDHPDEGFYEDLDGRAIRTKETLGRIVFSPLTRKRIFLLSCVAVSIDPLFFYIPIINDEKKCLAIDKNLRTAALCLRTLLDADFALHTISSGFRLYPHKELSFVDVLFYSFRSILVAVFLMLPIPQLAIAVFFFKSGGSGHFGQRLTVNIFLFFCYAARLVLIYMLSQELKYNTGLWVRASVNFFFYMVASNILGGFWYFFSIQREISCWQMQSCRNALGCGATYYCSDSTSRDITFLNELCPINPQNITVFNFGIFLEAIQSGCTRSMHFPTKFFYGVWWGVRNLSNFGTSLQTSSYVWETCFAVVISIAGLLLFLCLIGNVQIYIEQAKTKSLEAEEKEKELKAKILECKKAIRIWISKIAEGDNALAKNIWQKINENKLVEHKDAVKVDVNYMFSILHYYGRKLLKRHFCMEILKKVDRRDMGEEMLKIICNKMKLKTFEENTLVVEALHPLERMMIIIEGSLRMYQPTSDAAAAPQTPSQTIVFEEGDIVGHELVSWAASNPNFKDPPISNKHVKCLSKVTAFVLTSEDLRKLVSSKRIIFGTRAESGVFQWMR